METINAVSDLLELNRELNPNFPDQKVIWYRGQPLAKEPIPKLERIKTQNGNLIPDEVVNDLFLQRASSFLGGEQNYTVIYFTAQHYGLPTRLLDWTGNPLVALFFAAQKEPEQDEDGALYSIYPRSYYDKGLSAFQYLNSYREGEQIIEDAIKPLFGIGDKCTLSGNTVLPITPNWRFPRMVQQCSYFTLHLPGADAGQIDQRINAPVAVVPKTRKSELLRELCSLEINWASLFPDLENVAKEIQTSFARALAP